MKKTENHLSIEVVYATQTEQYIIPLRVPVGTTLKQAIEASGLLQWCPVLQNQEFSVGIFGKLCDLQQGVSEGDRIEIYRPLQNDPKETRRWRAKRNPIKKKKKGTS